MDNLNQPTAVHHTGTKTLFRSRVLERLTRTHVSVPILVFIFYAFGLLYWGMTRTALSGQLHFVLLLCGLLFFTWVEYNVHRYLFHLPVTTPARRKFQYTIHGVHHEFPKDKDRLAMPPIVSITIATLVLIIFRMLLGDLAFAFVSGFLIGYALYLFMHFILHAYPPPKNALRKLWQNHAIHHYKNGNVVFGVSSPLWDYVYGTMPNKHQGKQ